MKTLELSQMEMIEGGWFSQRTWCIISNAGWVAACAGAVLTGAGAMVGVAGMMAGTAGLLSC
jgi:hypothetical protein